jgi:hypothetical protein
MKRVFDLLSLLKMCCEEGMNGDWDCSTQEGKEGFNDMITIIEVIENKLKEKNNKFINLDFVGNSN